MAKYIESGIGTASKGSGFMLGQRAALDALACLKRYKPSLALVFISADVDAEAANRGVNDALNGCQLIGTSTSGGIANGLIERGVVVTLIASPYMNVRVGMGTGVAADYTRATQSALNQAAAAPYFDTHQLQHQTIDLATLNTPWVSPVLLIAFTPGSTKTQISHSHEIHTYLRKSSSNRIPVFGGSSGDDFRFETNCQFVNDRMDGDAIALAFIETEVRFGMGMAHGFDATKRRALITKSAGHVVHELDHQPAAKVFSELIKTPLKDLPKGMIPLYRYPFGITDIYGNATLLVPELVRDDGAIQFAPVMRSEQVITLMHATKKSITQASVKAYQRALLHGGLQKPALGLVFSCGLRRQLLGIDDHKEIELLHEECTIPIGGFYTYGEYGMSRDNFPVYSNQSVSTLVFSDELNPIAALIHRKQKVYAELAEQLDTKAFQIKSIDHFNKIIQKSTRVDKLMPALITELQPMLPWAEAAFYLKTNEDLKSYSIACVLAEKLFPEVLPSGDSHQDFMVIWLDSHGQRFGAMALKKKKYLPHPGEDDLVLAKTLGRLIAGGLYKIGVDDRLKIKMRHVEILNQIARELAMSMSDNTRPRKILEHVRKILQLTMVSLWVVDQNSKMMVKEAIEADPKKKVRHEDVVTDEQIAKWQVKNGRALFLTKGTAGQLPVTLKHPLKYNLVSFPILYKNDLRGVLNLYSKSDSKWYFQQDKMSENIEFLKNICGQIAMFLENKSLYKNTTLNREIHHRVKNNLQNIASLLRMQIRRLGRISPQQALEDSISRIMSIALVHETLSKDDIGLVDIGNLVSNIGSILTASTSTKPVITLDVSGAQVLMPSREATSLALVVNELIQNALQHGLVSNGDGRISIKITNDLQKILVWVNDNGPGLPSDFNLEEHQNLGLTIVRTLVEEDLCGEFKLDSHDGTTAHIALPLTPEYQAI
jgi:two-component sensor histidine kinase